MLLPKLHKKGSIKATEVFTTPTVGPSNLVNVIQTSAQTTKLTITSTPKSEIDLSNKSKKPILW